ncbi:MAG: T9SS type A sorting domain-containing protein [Saprospiraceae bacterium]|nr:T9SS type A sorting domain-containing protein [Saprospiraceae bacterium]
MKNTSLSRLLAALLLLLLALPGLHGQTQSADPECINSITGGIVPRSAFITYGSGIKMKSQTRRTKLTIGQTVVGSAFNATNEMNFGYWSGFLVAPFPPFVTATQGELLDRIQISWAPNPLGPLAVGGFKIYRDGVYLAQVDKTTRNYNDFNVIAGRAYNYDVRGINAYGEGSPGKALGFQVPNGVVTGWVRTQNDNPVPNALVTLMPMQGYSAYFGTQDGAYATPDTSTNNYFVSIAENNWAITFWIKNEQTVGNPTMFALKNIGSNALALQALNDGIQVNVGGGTLSGTFGAGSNGWHHVTVNCSDGQYRLYLDGILTDLNTGLAIEADELVIGQRASSDTWEGRLDELRIYHKRLDELDIPEIMEGTASSLTEGLKYYWKMDEEQGTKSFDVLNRNRLFFCGAVFSNDRPPVRTSGKTNEEGYYRIESASYGTGITFLAEPMKFFYKHRAVKFDRAELTNHAILPDFSVTPKATLETWINSAGPDGLQTVFAKKWNGSNSFQLQLQPNGVDNNIIFRLNGQVQDFGLLGLGYHHLAFTIDSIGGGTQVTAYKDGILIGTALLPSYTGNWSEPTQDWTLGALKSGTDLFEQFGGLIDEVALYDTTLSQATILSHFQNSRDPQEPGLRVYFAMDEGFGNQLNNAGSVFLSGQGMTFGTEWTVMSPNQSTTPHEFAPATRQVTLNPSITSVDQVDFTDRSTIPVSGFVRYQNTDCFAENVEILVNGESYSPAIYTDTTGKFVIDLEPGATVTLMPKFADHEFVPAFWDVTNVASPIAGIVFNDITTRKISGIVAGGDCKLPIISNPGTQSGTVCIVKVRSIDDCFERIIEIDNVDGEYEFLNLPPIEFTVAVVEHSDPTIKTAFQVDGGSQVDLRIITDTMVDFIYYAPPQVEIVSGLDPYSLTCPTVVLNQGANYTMGIALKEYYLGEGCPLDTGFIRIINEVSGEVKDTTLSNGLVQYKFRARLPNPSPPFLQNIQIIGTSLAGNESSVTKQVLVTGLLSKASTFTTQLPATPSLVLRDPPGDGSFAYLEKNEKTCQSINLSSETTSGSGIDVVLDFGPDLDVLVFATILSVESTIGPTIINSTSITKTTETSMEVCQSFSERISTSAEEFVVGSAANLPNQGWVQGGDVFMGTGLNVEFGFSDKVDFDTTTCGGIVEEVVSVSPKNFGTTFLYTDHYIRTNVIRYLEAIVNDPNTTPEKRDTCLTSIALWDKILDDNQLQKSAAKFIRNLSFTAGPEYEYAETSDTTSSSSSSTQNSRVFEFAFDIQAYVQGIGGGVTIHTSSETITGKTEDGASEKGVTTGYILADNDPGDAFTVDVAMDSVYKTPVFRTVSGQSSCPWEPKTAHRDGTGLSFRDNSGPVVVDIPSNEVAVYKFFLGNQSETNETRTYVLNAGANSNPDGAIIRLNGSVLDGPVGYQIEYGTSVPITITLERGPEMYDYDSLEIAFYSECEDDLASVLDMDSGNDTIAYSSVYISAHFIKPCSEVEINVPQQDWVVFPDPITQGPDDVMRITVSEYDKSQAEFDKIRVQYRPSDGDGAWINISPPVDSIINLIQPGAEILKADLGNIFTQFYWDTDELADGPYEIRAVALCTGDASAEPGYSRTIKGRIERQPPSLIGTPQPSDGVYHVGDEISFTFNKHVNCSKINALDNVLLFDASTDQPIDIDITCFENKIILNPNFQNQFFENKILRAELREIEDKTGNVLLFEKWEFYVDRNELAWLTDSIGMTKYEDQTKTVTANIHNRGGYPVPFTIEDIPPYVHVVPNEGTLAANEIRAISFTVDSSQAFGLWSDSITLHTNIGQNPFFMGGDEQLPFGVRVVCRPPNWNLDANQFENTENMVLELNIEGIVSDDVEDMVVAYIGDTLMGRANVQYVPEVDKYLAYLTIYGNPYHVLEPMRLEIWDASACLRYAVVEDYFLFQPDEVIGDPLAPQVIHTNNLVLRDVPLGYGWNWISFNLEFVDPEINAALASLSNPENDLMKGQNQFSTFFSGSWLGSLQNLGNTSMYIYRANQADTLTMAGQVINPATSPIPVVTGWNWIGYIPNYSLPVNEALSSLSSQTGDIIKSQISFAQYINPTFGWIGNLKYMSPPNGYQIKLAAPGTLVYPPAPSNRLMEGMHDLRPIAAADRGSSYWSVDPTQYEHGMTLIGMLQSNGENTTGAGMELGAFAGEQVRGSAPSIYVEPLDAYLFFMTVYANSSGEPIHYKLFDSESGNISMLNETMFFTPDLHQGSIEDPVPFTGLNSSAPEMSASSLSLEVQPNPFTTETMLRFHLPKAEEITLTISNAAGQTVTSLHSAGHAGFNTAVWRGENDKGTRLASGVYFVHLQTQSGSVVQKVVLQ